MTPDEAAKLLAEFPDPPVWVFDRTYAEARAACQLRAAAFPAARKHRMTRAQAEIARAIRELQSLLPRDARGDVAGPIDPATGARIEECIGAIYAALPPDASSPGSV